MAERKMRSSLRKTRRPSPYPTPAPSTRASLTPAPPDFSTLGLVSPDASPVMSVGFMTLSPLTPALSLAPLSSEEIPTDGPTASGSAEYAGHHDTQNNSNAGSNGSDRGRGRARGRGRESENPAELAPPNDPNVVPRNRGRGRRGGRGRGRGRGRRRGGRVTSPCPRGALPLPPCQAQQQQQQLLEEGEDQQPPQLSYIASDQPAVTLHRDGDATRAIDSLSQSHLIDFQGNRARATIEVFKTVLAGDMLSWPDMVPNSLGAVARQVHALEKTDETHQFAKAIAYIHLSATFNK